jgi:hypothetical protein
MRGMHAIGQKRTEADKQDDQASCKRLLGMAWEATN